MAVRPTNGIRDSKTITIHVSQDARDGAILSGFETEVSGQRIAYITVSGADNDLFYTNSENELLYFAPSDSEIGDVGKSFNIKLGICIGVKYFTYDVVIVVDAEEEEEDGAASAISYANSQELSQVNYSVDEGVYENGFYLADVTIADIGIPPTLTLDDARFEYRNEDGSAYTGGDVAQLWLKAGVELDYETASSIEVELGAGGTDDTNTFTLQVNDVNEAPTALLISQTEFTLTDNVMGSRYGLKIADLTIVDDDLGTNRFLSLDENSPFVIRRSGNDDEAALWIKSSRQFDYSTQGSYTIDITLRGDGRDQVELTQTVQLNVVEYDPIITIVPTNGFIDGDDMTLYLSEDAGDQSIVSGFEVPNSAYLLGAVIEFGVDTLNFRVNGNNELVYQHGGEAQESYNLTMLLIVAPIYNSTGYAPGEDGIFYYNTTIIVGEPPETPEPEVVTPPEPIVPDPESTGNEYVWNFDSVASNHFLAIDEARTIDDFVLGRDSLTLVDHSDTPINLAEFKAAMHAGDMKVYVYWDVAGEFTGIGFFFRAPEEDGNRNRILRLNLADEHELDENEEIVEAITALNTHQRNGNLINQGIDDVEKLFGDLLFITDEAGAIMPNVNTPPSVAVAIAGDTMFTGEDPAPGTSADISFAKSQALADLQNGVPADEYSIDEGVYANGFHIANVEAADVGVPITLTLADSRFEYRKADGTAYTGGNGAQLWLKAGAALDYETATSIEIALGVANNLIPAKDITLYLNDIDDEPTAIIVTPAEGLGVATAGGGIRYFVPETIKGDGTSIKLADIGITGADIANYTPYFHLRGSRTPESLDNEHSLYRLEEGANGWELWLREDANIDYESRPTRSDLKAIIRLADDDGVDVPGLRFRYKPRVLDQAEFINPEDRTEIDEAIGYQFSVREDVTGGYSIGSVEINYDAAAGYGDVFYFIDGGDSGLFDIDEVTVAGRRQANIILLGRTALDLDADGDNAITSYTFKLFVEITEPTDSNAPYQFINLAGNDVEEFGAQQISVTITVEEVDEAPIIVTPIADVTHIENSAKPPARINLAEIFEDDGGDDNLTYSISGYEGADIFLYKGKITFLSRPTLGEHTITVTATDADGNTAQDEFVYTVEVNPEAKFYNRPMLHIEHDVTPQVGEHLRLSGIFGVPNTVLTLTWFLNGEMVASGNRVDGNYPYRYTPTEAGELSATISFTDDAGNYNYDEITDIRFYYTDEEGTQHHADHWAKSITITAADGGDDGVPTPTTEPTITLPPTSPPIAPPQVPPTIPTPEIVPPVPEVPDVTIGETFAIEILEVSRLPQYRQSEISDSDTPLFAGYAFYIPDNGLSAWDYAWSISSAGSSADFILTHHDYEGQDVMALSFLGGAEIAAGDYDILINVTNSDGMVASIMQTLTVLTDEDSRTTSYNIGFSEDGAYALINDDGNIDNFLRGVDVLGFELKRSGEGDNRSAEQIFNDALGQEFSVRPNFDFADQEVDGLTFLFTQTLIYGNGQATQSLMQVNFADSISIDDFVNDIRNPDTRTEYDFDSSLATITSLNAIENVLGGDASLDLSLIDTLDATTPNIL